MAILQKLFLRIVLAWMGLPRLVRHLRSSRWIGQIFTLTRFGKGQCCLEQSLLEIYSRARTGERPRLAIGVKKSGGQFQAHAWVELSHEGIDEHDGFKKLGVL